jgi:hypothetical protein
MGRVIETAPQMNLTVQEIAHLGEELREYHSIYSPLFERREQREWAARLHIPILSIESLDCSGISILINVLQATSRSNHPCNDFPNERDSQ